MLEIFPFAASAASFRVSTLSVKDIGTSSAVITGRSDTNGGYNYRGYGFMYREAASGSWKSVGWRNGHLSSGSTYSYCISGLNPGTLYEYEFYVVSSNAGLGTSYGAVMTFTTAAEKSSSSSSSKASSASSKTSSASSKTAGSTANSSAVSSSSKTSSKAKKLDTPEITSPKSGSTSALSSEITFRWSSVSGAAYYQYSLKDINTGTYLYENVNTTSRSIKIPKSKLAGGHRFKFAVGAYNSTIASDWDTVTITVKETETDIQASVAEKLKSLAGKNSDYKVGKVYLGLGECKGFANMIFNELFAVSVGSTTSSKFAVNSDPKYVFCVGTIKNITANDVRTLFDEAKIGDFVQMKRRGRTTPHSAIIYELDNGGVKFYEANMDGMNGIQTEYYSWEKLAAANDSMSVYEAVDYRLK